MASFSIGVACFGRRETIAAAHPMLVQALCMALVVLLAGVAAILFQLLSHLGGTRTLATDAYLIAQGCSLGAFTLLASFTSSSAPGALTLIDWLLGWQLSAAGTPCDDALRRAACLLPSNERVGPTATRALAPPSACKLLLPILYALCLPWLCAGPWAQWPPQRPLGQPPTGVASLASLLGTPPATATFACLVLHFGLPPSWPSAWEGEAWPFSSKRDAAELASATCRLFWSTLAVSLAVTETYQPAVHFATRQACALLALAHLILVGISVPWRLSAGERARTTVLLRSLAGTLAAGIVAAAVCLAHAPLLALPTGESKPWARVPWPWSSSNDHVLWLSETAMLAVMLAAPFLARSWANDQVSASRPKPGAPVSLMF